MAESRDGSQSLLQSLAELNIKVNNRPRLPHFRGGLASSGDHAAYDVWRFDLECILQEQHSDSDVSDAIRQSLKGEAAKVAMRLGPHASTADLIKKFDSIYGTIEEKETTLYHFYSARQHENESVAAWSCRLEDILNKSVQKGEIKHSQTNSMLRNMLWTGLKKELKDISGYKFDKIDDFDELRLALRQLENDLQSDTSSKAHIFSAASISTKEDKTQQELDSLKAMMANLTKEFRDFKRTHVSAVQTTDTEAGSFHQTNLNPTPNYRGYGWGSRFTRGKIYGSSQNRYQQHRTQTKPPVGPQCFSCGGIGHLSYDCANNQNYRPHSRSRGTRRPLNGARPMRRGHP